MATQRPPSVAIVTGAASGIGLALTKHLTAKGYKVFMADVSPSGASVASSISSTTSSANAPTFIHTDVSSWVSQASLFKRAYTHSYHIAFFAANAGIDDREDLFSSWDLDAEPQVPNTLTIDTDLTAVVYGLKLFIHYARKSAAEKGASSTTTSERKSEGEHKMVITSSMMGLYPMPSNPQYSASKHGLIGLTRSLGAQLLGEDNTSLNAILPAFVPTGLAPPGLIEAMEDRGHITPMTTILKAYDAILDNGSLTGQTVEVSLQELFWRKPVEYPNESQRWLADDPDGFWREMYERKGKGSVKEERKDFGDR